MSREQTKPRSELELRGIRIVREVRFEGQQAIEALATTPDGKLALSRSRSEIRLWNIRTGECLKVIRARIDHVGSVALTADGRRALEIYPEVQGPGTLGPYSRATSIALLRIWNLDDEKLEHTFVDTLLALQVVQTTSNSDIAVAGIGDRLTIFRVTDKAVVRSFQSGVVPWRSRIDEIMQKPPVPDMTALATAAESPYGVSADSEGAVKVWDLDAACLRQLIQAHDAPVSAVAITGDGNTVLSGASAPDCTVRQWHTTTRECRQILAGHTDGIVGLAATADARHALSCSHDRSVRIWSLDTGQCVQAFEANGSSVSAFAATLDADFMLVAGGSKERNTDNALRIWELVWQPRAEP